MLNSLIHLAAYFFALLALCGLGYLGFRCGANGGSWLGGVRQVCGRRVRYAPG